MDIISVNNKKELIKAQTSKVDEIIVLGEVAKQLQKSRIIATVGKISLGILTVAIGTAAITAPITGGLSFAVAEPIAAISGFEIAAIISGNFNRNNISSINI